MMMYHNITRASTQHAPPPFFRPLSSPLLSLPLSVILTSHHHKVYPLTKTKKAKKKHLLISRLRHVCGVDSPVQ